MKKRYCFFLFHFFVSLISLQNINAQWTNYQDAEYVIGQPDFTTYTPGTTLQKFNYPQQVAIDYINNKMYVAEYMNNRVLRFAYPITSSNPTAERIFGNGTTDPKQNTISTPVGVAVYNGTLWVSDYSNNRVLKFNNAHSAASNSPNADCVLGQINYTSKVSNVTSQANLNSPRGIFIDSNGNLWVADHGNNRILKFNDVNSKGIGASADLVLGQLDFTTKTSGTSSTNLYFPRGVTVFGTTVWVADSQNSRVLRYDNPTANGVTANGVLGQSLFSTSLTGTTSTTFVGPNMLSVDGSGRLYVSDESNGRIMIFNNAAAKGNGAAADNVLGQPNFTTRVTTNGGQKGFYYENNIDFGNLFTVSSVSVDPINNKILVTDGINSRIMQFAASSALPVELTSFTGYALGNSVNLNWATATEVNNYGFNVERCKGQGTRDEVLEKGTSASYSSSSELRLSASWETLAFVQGHGNSNSPKSYSFTDVNAPSGKVQYRLKQIDFDGKYEYSDVVEVNVETPASFSLNQNYPNPCNPTTVISYQVQAASHVTIKVYDLLGREVAALVNEMKSPGNYELTFDGSKLASGVYTYTMNAGNYTSTKKMILMK